MITDDLFLLIIIDSNSYKIKIYKMGNCADSTETKDPIKFTSIASLNQQPSVLSPQQRKSKIKLPPLTQSKSINNKSDKQQSSDFRVTKKKLNFKEEEEQQGCSQFQQIQLKLHSSIKKSSSRPVIKKPYKNQNNQDSQSKRNQRNSQSKLLLINCIKEDIETKPILTSLLSMNFFQKLNELFVIETWSYDYLALITKLLLDYVNFSMSELSSDLKNWTPYTLSNFAEMFSKQLSALYKQVKMRNSRLGLSREYYELFKKKKYSLDSTQAIQQIFNQISGCSFDSKAFLPFVSVYLIRSCLKLQSKNVGLEQINEKLQKYIMELSTKYQVMKKKACEQHKHQFATFYGKQLEQINQFQAQNQEIINKVYIFKNKDKHLKYQELNIIINSLKEQAKKYYSLFTQITAKACFQNQGFGFETHLKFNNYRDLFTQLCLQEQFCCLEGKSIEKIIPKGCKTIENLRQVDHRAVKTALIYSYCDKNQIELSSKDLLFGQCAFNNINDIKQMIRSLKKSMKIQSEKGQEIKIISIENKLAEEGKIILRFKLGQLICSFKLYLRVFQALNQICEGMEQIKNSKLFSSTTLLLEWHERVCNRYFTLLSETKRKENRKQIQSMKQFFKFEREINKQQIEIELQNEKYYEMYFKLKAKMIDLKVNQKLNERTQIRSAKCFTELKFYKQSLSELKRFTNTQDLEWMYLMSLSYKNCSLTLQATRHYEAFISSALINNDQSNPYIVLAYKALCQCYIENGHYRKGVELAEKLHAMQASRYSSISLQCAEVLIIIGKALNLLGKPHQALKRYQKSINIFDELRAISNPEYIRAYYGIAEIYASQGKVFEVSKAFLQVIAAQQQIHGENLETAEKLTDIGMVYMVVQELKQSQVYLKLSVEMTESLVGRQALQYYSSLVAMSNLYKRLQRYDAAEQLIKICMSIVAKQIGELSYDNAVLYSYLGSIRRGKNDINYAIKHFQQSLRIMKEIGEEGTMSHLLVCKQLLNCYRIKKNKEELMNCYESMIQLVTNIYGQNSMQSADIESSLGQIFIQNGIYDLGQEACIQSIQKFQSLQIDFNPVYVKAVKNLIEIYLRTQKQEKASPLLKKIIHIYEKNLIKNIDYANLCHLYAEMCQENKLQYDAQQWLRKSLVVYNKLNHSNSKLVEQQLSSLSPKKANSPIKS